MILEFDCGNTSAKWRLLSDGDAVANGVHSYDEGFERLFASLFSSPLLADKGFVGCRVASVAGDDLNTQLQSSWQSRSSAPIEFARVKAICAGIQCGYLECSQMGVDRWSALLGASRISDGSCIVVDAGTAITLDFLDGIGKHSGGYILPGIELMLSSLLENTAIPNERIPTLDMIGGLRLGASTVDAIASGIGKLCQALLSQVIRDFDEGAEVYLTGGNAALVQSFLDHPAIVAPDLVLDGLALLVPFDDK